MSETIYDAPKSNLDATETKILSASEKLAQSRRDIEESSAKERLNFVWGIRFAIDILFILFVLVGIFGSLSDGYGYGLVLGVGVFILALYGAEIFSIIGYFRRQSWCVVPLHIFSAISLLNFPFGTILSIIHYVNMGKIQFDKNDY